MKALAFVTLTVSVLTAASTPATALTIRVPSDQPTIQDGIDAASYGDTVLVECGTYYEHDIEMKSGIVLRSETGSPDCVTIDAQQQGRIFYCDGVDNQTSIVGLSIVAGFTEGYGGGMYCTSSALALTNCTFEGGQGGRGGGVHCTGSSPTLVGCTFEGNRGHGMYCDDSSPTLVGCTFSGNSGAAGGGMYCKFSLLTLTDCTFSGNRGYNWGGGGMHCFGSTATFTNCTFSGNYTEYDGAGVMFESSSATLVGCTFEKNEAYYWGGGMMCWDSSPVLTGCTFVGNQATLGGGVICRYASAHPTLTNCVIAFSTQGEAVACQIDGDITLTCCDVYGNAGGDWVGCIADQYGVDDNFSEDPLFCYGDSPGEPYSLHEGSPCLPENSPCGELIGTFGQGCGVPTAVEAINWSAIKAMFR